MQDVILEPLHPQSASLESPADAAAAGFYSGNPNNVWLHNAASGGFAGFSFPVLPRPVRVRVGCPCHWQGGHPWVGLGRSSRGCV